MTYTATQQCREVSILIPLTITESAPKIAGVTNPTQSGTRASFNLRMRARLMRSSLKNRSTDFLYKI